MAFPLMPKATAVWLVENTRLTFDQIAAFTGLHKLEVQGIADGEVAIGMVGLDPVAGGQISKEELARAEGDPTVRLALIHKDLPAPVKRAKGPRYTPVTKRAEKPDAIAWLIKQYPSLSDTQIGRLIGTTKTTIQSVRNKTHETASTIKPKSPVLLGLCTQAELDEAISKIRAKAGSMAPAEIAHDDAEIEIEDGNTEAAEH
jgi:hypothetical protein